MFNNEWMREKGFLESSGMTARDLVAQGLSGELRSLECNEPVEHAVALMSEHDFSQISITHEQRLVGSLDEAHLYQELVSNPNVKRQPVESIMQPAFPFVDASTPVELLSTMITTQSPAVLVRDFKSGKPFIITRSDVIRVL
jgi:cystathionine beta-synthase